MVRNCVFTVFSKCKPQWKMQPKNKWHSTDWNLYYIHYTNLLEQWASAAYNSISVHAYQCTGLKKTMTNYEAELLIQNSIYRWNMLTDGWIKSPLYVISWCKIHRNMPLQISCYQELSRAVKK
jgi:hypothetical protein